jgi:hypothetical protein
VSSLQYVCYLAESRASFIGRQLFESDKNLEMLEDTFNEEGTVSVDFSQYERTRKEEEEEEERITFSDDE